MTRGRAVGIDLGTTNSVVAVIDRDGAPRILTTDEGSTTLPSLVWFSRGRVLGTGESFQATLSLGAHRVQLWAFGDDGTVAKKSILVRVRNFGSEKEVASPELVQPGDASSERNRELGLA